MTKLKLKKIISAVDFSSYDKEKIYNELYNNVIDYMNDTQDCSLEYLFNDFISYETAQEIAEQQLEDGGLLRLKYFLGDTVLHDEDIFKIDGYGNLDNVTINELRDLQEDIINTLNNN